MQPAELKIFHKQILVENTYVYSAQWVLLPCTNASITPSLMMERYLQHIRRATFSLIRPTRTRSGIDFNILSSRLSLLAFAPPEEERFSMKLPIRGGLLVQKGYAYNGKFAFSVEQGEGGMRLMLELSGFRPLLLGRPNPTKLCRWFYRLTQALIHKKVCISFVIRMVEQACVEKVPVRVVQVSGPEGSDI
ncbi:hypothetical protein [Geobacter sp. DSM 9736]|uniref:hypothetical protein n=1 Tax=Geobacter sp. DSM 9736 TaxID=1277350 RepID=UPI000B50E396|nr:hypothetical protein [Geobacter sp. DSM 9736]SNB47767.1 hypothetical protein SAMN06269301_3259 [Geobacter sp. DSM 9736]